MTSGPRLTGRGVNTPKQRLSRQEAPEEGLGGTAAQRGRRKARVGLGLPGGPGVKTSPSRAGTVGLIPAREAEIPQALQPKSQNTKQKQYCNKFDKDFKKGPHQIFFFKS